MVLRREVKKYRTINNYPIGSNFEHDLEQNVCANSDPYNCVDLEDTKLAKKAGRFARAMVNWAKSGFKLRSQEEVDKVMEICESCYYFGGETGALKIVCKKCGCAGLKLMLSTEKCPISKW